MRRLESILSASLLTACLVACQSTPSGTLTGEEIIVAGIPFSAGTAVITWTHVPEAVLEDVPVSAVHVERTDLENGSALWVGFKQGRGELGHELFGCGVFV